MAGRPPVGLGAVNLVRIAVIGSGIAGLGAAYVLSRAHHVEVFEREPRLGGHAHTHDIPVPGGVQPLDTGFLVFNERTYPNFIRLLEQLGVASHATDMCFGVQCRRCGLEYASQSLSSLVAQRWRVLDPRHMGDAVRDRPVLPAVPGSSCSPPRATTSRSAAFCRGRASRRA